MLDLVATLQNTPIPNVLLITGLIFLFLAFAGKFAFGIDVSQTSSRRTWIGIIGIIFLLSGIVLHIIPSSSSPTFGIIETLQNTPIPSLLIISGITFLFLSIVGQIGDFELPIERQKWIGVIGSLLLILGIGLYLIPSTEKIPIVAITSIILSSLGLIIMFYVAFKKYKREALEKHLAVKKLREQEHDLLVTIEADISELLSERVH